MAILRAVAILLSVLLVTTFYSNILEDEVSNHELDGKDTSKAEPGRDEEYQPGFYLETLTAGSGSFESPDYPTASHHDDCMWLIKASKGSIIRLVITELNTEKGFDFVFVHDGGGTDFPLLGAYSGDLIPSAIRSTSNQMLVRFVTDGKNQSQGFQANYYSIPPCYFVSRESVGIITSPYYPNPYDNNLICDWLIVVGEDETILFEFLDVETEEYYDIIQIFDGDNDRSPFLRRISGSIDKKTPYVQQSSSNVALVRFSTDRRGTNKGFLARYTAGNALDLAIHFLSEYAHLFQDSDSSATNDEVLDQTDVENIAKSAVKAGISVESLKQAVSLNQLSISSNSSL